MLRTSCSVEHTPVKKDSLHASGRRKVPGFDRDRGSLAASSIGDFQIVTPDQTIISFGVAYAFEGKGDFRHTSSQGRHQFQADAG